MSRQQDIQHDKRTSWSDKIKVPSFRKKQENVGEDVICSEVDFRGKGDTPGARPTSDGMETSKSVMDIIAGPPLQSTAPPSAVRSLFMTPKQPVDNPVPIETVTAPLRRSSFTPPQQTIHTTNSTRIATTSVPAHTRESPESRNGHRELAEGVAKSLSPDNQACNSTTDLQSGGKESESVVSPTSFTSPLRAAQIGEGLLSYLDSTSDGMEEPYEPPVARLDASPYSKRSYSSPIVSAPSVSSLDAHSASTTPPHPPSRYDADGEALKKRIDSLMNRFNSSTLATGSAAVRSPLPSAHTSAVFATVASGSGVGSKGRDVPACIPHPTQAEVLADSIGVTPTHQSISTATSFTRSVSALPSTDSPSEDDGSDGSVEGEYVSVSDSAGASLSRRHSLDTIDTTTSVVSAPSQDSPRNECTKHNAKIPKNVHVSQIQGAALRRNSCNRSYTAPRSIPTGTSADKSRIQARKSMWCDVALYTGCAFCGFIYDNKGWEAMTLACGHSFCLSCNELTLSLYCSSNPMQLDVLCPVCCASVSILLDPSKVKTSHTTATLSSDSSSVALLGVDELEDTGTVCENCEEAKATLWCEFCRINFCSQCDVEIHSSNAMKKHLRCAVAGNNETLSVISGDRDDFSALKEAEDSPGKRSGGGSPEKSKKVSRIVIHASRLPAVCGTHRLHILDKFCQQCLCVVCAECASTAGDQHSDHVVVSLESPTGEFRDRLGDTIQLAKSHLRDIRSVQLKLDASIAALRVTSDSDLSLTTPIVRVKDGDKCFPNAYDEAVEIVENEFQSLFSAIQTRRLELVEAVLLIGDERVGLLLEEQKRVLSIRDRAAQAVTRAQTCNMTSASGTGEFASSVWNLRSVLSEGLAFSDRGILNGDIHVEFSRYELHIVQAFGNIVVEEELTYLEAHSMPGAPAEESVHVLSTPPRESSGSEDGTACDAESFRLQQVEAHNLMLQAMHLQDEADTVQKHIDRIMVSLTGGLSGKGKSLSHAMGQKGGVRESPQRTIGVSSGVVPSSSPQRIADTPGEECAIERATRTVERHFDELLAAATLRKDELIPQLRAYVDLKRKYYLSVMDDIVSMQSRMLFYSLQILHACHSDNYLIATKYISPNGNQLADDFFNSFRSDFYLPLREHIYPHVPLTFALPGNQLLRDYGSVGAPPAPANVRANMNYGGNGHSVELAWSTSTRNDWPCRVVKFVIQLSVGRALAASDVLTIDTYEVPFTEVLVCDGGTYEATIDVQDYPGRIVQFRVRAICSESREPSSWSEPCSLCTPDSFRRVFEYQSSFDQGGLLYWLGTNAGSAPYCNPHLSGVVHVTMSTSSTPPHMFVDHVPDRSYCMTADRVQQWICLDIGPNRLLHPTGYCLRTAKGDTWKLRNWDLQARAEKTDKWVVIRRHKNCKTLATTSYSVGAWKIEIPSADAAVTYASGTSTGKGKVRRCTSSSVPAAATPGPDEESHSLKASCGDSRAYRYFRILQTGKNSSRDNYLVCNGIELYGVLYTCDETSDSGHIVKMKNSAEISDKN